MAEPDENWGDFDVAGGVSSTAPGRVNLIGEHTDYSGLPVLPMAIDRPVEISAAPNASRGLRIRSLAYPDSISLNSSTILETLAGWHRYCFAAASVTDSLELQADVLVSGTLPSGGGLSSSSALTVGLISAFLKLRSIKASHDELVSLSVSAERMTGVAGGEMDQNVIVRAQKGHALRIGFKPFSATQVAIPDSFAIVAAYSGVKAEKGSGAKRSYNSRVVGCRIAAVLLAAESGMPSQLPPSLGDVVTFTSPNDLQGLPESATASLIDDASTTAAIVSGTDLQPDSAVPVRACAAHVLSEAARVDMAVEAIVEADMQRLGELLDESHGSLQRFGVSHSELDRLVMTMRSAGGAGARLTGAGFGGYAIAVCPPEAVESVVSAAIGVTGGPAFQVRPSGGAS